MIVTTLGLSRSPYFVVAAPQSFAAAGGESVLGVVRDLSARARGDGARGFKRVPVLRGEVVQGRGPCLRRVGQVEAAEAERVAEGCPEGVTGTGDGVG